MHLNQYFYQVIKKCITLVSTMHFALSKAQIYTSDNGYGGLFIVNIIRLCGWIKYLF